MTDLKEKLKKAKLRTMQQNFEKELKTLGLEYDMFKQKKLRTEMKYENATANRKHDQFMNLFGGGSAAMGQGPEIDSDLLGGYGVNLNRYKRLMDDYGHRKRFRRVISAVGIK